MIKQRAGVHWCAHQTFFECSSCVNMIYIWGGVPKGPPTPSPAIVGFASAPGCGDAGGGGGGARPYHDGDHNGAVDVKARVPEAIGGVDAHGMGQRALAHCAHVMCGRGLHLQTVGRQHLRTCAFVHNTEAGRCALSMGTSRRGKRGPFRQPPPPRAGRAAGARHRNEISAPHRVPLSYELFRIHTPVGFTCITRGKLSMDFSGPYPNAVTRLSKGDNACNRHCKLTHCKLVHRIAEDNLGMNNWCLWSNTCCSNKRPKKRSFHPQTTSKFWKTPFFMSEAADASGKSWSQCPKTITIADLKASEHSSGQLLVQRGGSLGLWRLVGNRRRWAGPRG